MDAFPEPGGKAQAGSVAITAGGPAANAACSVARLGGRATLLTAVGDHPLSGIVRATLAGAGVSVVDFAPAGFLPPVSAVTVRSGDGERTIVAHNAAGTELLLDHQRIADELSTTDAVLLDGHHPDLALAVARGAGDVPVCVDAGSWRPVFADLLGLADVCACSPSFAFPDARPEPDYGVPVVTRTHGPNPVRWWADGEHGTVPVAPVQARDTTGAGDAWHGALAHGVGRLGRVPRVSELPEIIAKASRAAGTHVARAPAPRDR